MLNLTRVPKKISGWAFQLSPFRHPSHCDRNRKIIYPNKWNKIGNENFVQITDFENSTSTKAKDLKNEQINTTSGKTTRKDSRTEENQAVMELLKNIIKTQQTQNRIQSTLLNHCAQYFNSPPSLQQPNR